MFDGKWIVDFLAAITASAAEHPLLVGLLLLFALLSSAAQLLILAEDVLLALSQHFRAQTVELLDRWKRIREELRAWGRDLRGAEIVEVQSLKEDTDDVARVASMTAAEVDAELARYGLDPERAIDVVTALKRAALLELRNDERDSLNPASKQEEAEPHLTAD